MRIPFQATAQAQARSQVIAHPAKGNIDPKLQIERTKILVGLLDPLNSDVDRRGDGGLGRGNIGQAIRLRW